MAGLCGIVGESRHLDRLTRALVHSRDEVRTSYEAGPVGIGGVFHQAGAADQPAEADDALVWIWGDIYGVDAGAGYEARSPPIAGTNAAYCASLYDDHGLDFVSGLNGSFCGIIYEPAAGSVSVFVDRLASRDLFYTRTTDGTLVVSSLAQSLSLHPNVRAAFDYDHLAEYFGADRGGRWGPGVKTPLERVEAIPPGTIISVDVDTDAVATRRYWQPRYRPIDRPYSYFVQRFAELTETIVAERVADDRAYGLLLSGGTDSRLLLAALPDDADVTAYHMAGWMSREARVAERAALTADIDFEWLRRDAGYDRRLLDRTPPISNFVGDFAQAQAQGFRDRLRSDVDVLLSGQMTGRLTKDHAVPHHHLSLGPLGTRPLPIRRSIEEFDTYLEWRANHAPTNLPTFLDDPPTPETLLRRQSSITNDGRIHDHGVEYESLETFQVAYPYYPVRNVFDFFAPALMQVTASRDPHMDNRIIDLRHRMPLKYLVRPNLAQDALRVIDGDLAAIPHAGSGVPPTYPFPIDWLAETLVKFGRIKLGLRERPPRPYLSQGPWPDRDAVIRTQSFVRDRLTEHEDRIRSLPFLDWDGVIDCVDRASSGDSMRTELYPLLTVLEMPVTQRVVDDLS